MINAAAPIADDQENYLYVAEHRASKKSEPRPMALMSTVLTLYKEYLSRLGDTDGPGVHPFLPEDAEALTTNADYLTLVRFSNLRKEILMSIPTNKCAYCYQIRAHEVDHYLPKSKFGEYSIYSPNLVPICTVCNRKKLNRYRRVGGGRRFVHPYIDTLPDSSTRYLTGTVVIKTSVVVKYQLARPDGINDEFWAIIENHYKDLDLLSRYEVEATEEMMLMLNAFYAYYERGGVDMLRGELSTLKDSREIIYGVNHWWTTLYQLLVNSEEFCDRGFTALGSDPGRL